METKEIEVRFLEIDKEALVKKLLQLGAEDFGEVKLEEVIFYDPEAKWREENKFIRLRKSGEKIKLTYKEHKEKLIDGTTEIEFKVDKMDMAEAFIEKLGFPAFRHQEKLRHTFEFEGVIVDIDTWPRIPPYVEIEGPSENAIKEVAEKLGLDWDKVVYDNAGFVIQNTYKIPVLTMKWFTFDRFE